MKHLSPDEMNDLASEEDGIINFDFSMISSDKYEQFFHSLPNFLYKKCKAVCFSCDFAKNAKSGSEKETIWYQSIAVMKPKFLKYLFKILRNVLPKSKSLCYLGFSNLDIPDKLLLTLMQYISTYKSLDSLSFKNTVISDENFAYIMKHTSPYKFKKFEFIDAQIDSKVFYQIYKFLKRKPNDDDATWVLKEFNVSMCKFKPREFEKIRELIQRHTPKEGTPLEQLSETSSDDEPAPPPKPIKTKSKKTAKTKKIEKEPEPIIVKPPTPPPEPEPKLDLEYEEEEEEEGSTENVVIKTAQSDSSSEPSETDTEIIDDVIETKPAYIPLSDDEQQQELGEPLTEEDIAKLNALSEQVPRTQETDDQQQLNRDLKTELENLMQSMNAVQITEDIFVLTSEYQELAKQCSDVL